MEREKEKNGKIREKTSKFKIRCINFDTRRFAVPCFSNVYAPNIFFINVIIFFFMLHFVLPSFTSVVVVRNSLNEKCISIEEKEEDKIIFTSGAFVVTKITTTLASRLQMWKVQVDFYWNQIQKSCSFYVCLHFFPFKYKIMSFLFILHAAFVITII